MLKGKTIHVVQFVDLKVFADFSLQLNFNLLSDRHVNIHSRDDLVEVCCVRGWSSGKGDCLLCVCVPVEAL